MDKTPVLSSGEKVAILIQARSQSTRLPRKCFLPLPPPDGPSLLEWIYRRMTSTGLPVFFIVPDEDGEIRSFMERKGWSYLVGPEDDVRERYRFAARHLGLDTIIRATGDNPFTDPENVLLCLEKFRSGEYDLFSFTGLPLGLGVEIFSSEALFRDVPPDDPACREHVSLHIKHHPEVFRVAHETDPRLLTEPFPGIDGFSSIRLTVDEETDYQTASAVAEVLPSTGTSLRDVLRLYVREPERFRGNAHVEQRRFDRKP